MDIDNLYQIKNKFASRNIDDELILVPIKNNVADMNKLFTLNKVGAFIWENIDENKTAKDIVELVMQEFEVDQITAENDTHAFLSKLNSLLSV